MLKKFLTDGDAVVKKSNQKLLIFKNKPQFFGFD